MDHNNIQHLDLPNWFIMYLSLYKHYDNPLNWIYSRNEETNEINGFLCLKLIENNIQYELVFAYVNKNERRKGILRKMMLCIPNEWLIQINITNEHEKNALKIWKHLGVKKNQKNNQYEYKWNKSYI